MKKQENKLTSKLDNVLSSKVTTIPVDQIAQIKGGIAIEDMML